MDVPKRFKQDRTLDGDLHRMKSRGIPDARRAPQAGPRTLPRRFQPAQGRGSRSKPVSSRIFANSSISAQALPALKPPALPSWTRRGAFRPGLPHRRRRERDQRCSAEGQEKPVSGSSRASIGAARAPRTTFAPTPPTARRASRRTKKSAARSAARTGRRRRSWLAASSIGAPCSSVWGLISTVALVVYYASQLPPIDQLAVPKRPPNIAILADDGSLIANRGDTGGPAIRLIDLPPYLPKAFVAIEDRRFYDHIGIDPLGVARALMRDVDREERHRGRLDADPAAGEEPVPDPGAHAVAQDPGGDPGAVARAPVFEGPDPRALSQPRLLRLGRLWGRGGGAEIFRQERALRDPAGSRAARGADEVADQARAQPQPRGRQRARRRGHHRDGRAGPHHRGDGQVRARQSRPRWSTTRAQARSTTSPTTSWTRSTTRSARSTTTSW